jgi:signal transduction histidine kinase
LGGDFFSQFYFDYSMGVKSIERTMAEIRSTQLSTLTENLWTMNQDQVKTQLQGLLEIESIIELTIIPPKDKTEYRGSADSFSVKKQKSDTYSSILKTPEDIIENYPLTYKRDDQSYSLGSLKIVADKGPVVEALQSRVLVILLTQGAKTFLVSFFIIFIFNSLVNRHIIQVSRFAKQVSLENMNTRLSLPRKPQKQPDELDRLVQSLNLMQVKITNEVAQRKHFEQQLRQSQKMEALGTLASGIAHDFNNILQGLYNALFLIEEEVIDNAEALSNLNLATNLTDRARELIKQILIFSRQEEGHFTNFSPTSAIQDVVEILRAARPKDVSIDLLLDLPKAKLFGDQTQLKQVILNLGNNAIVALENIERPQLTIKVSSETIQRKSNLELNPGNYLKIEVKDNGIGIDPKIQERIFEPFFTTKEVGKGTGLGLSVVHGIVQNHGGAILLESTPSKGSLFTVYFPFEQGQRLESPIVYSKKEEVHIISNDLLFHQEIEKKLKLIGHKRVVVHQESESALVKIKLQRNSENQNGMIFIIDEEVTGFPAVELIRKLRQFFPKTPVIYLTESTTPLNQVPPSLEVLPKTKTSTIEEEQGELAEELREAFDLIS